MTPRSGSDASAPLPAAYILAGGHSRRFGRDKARFEFAGKPLMQHAVDLVSPYAVRTMAVAQDEGQYDDLGVTTIADAIEDCGPLGGLHAALRDADDPSWIWLVACDWVGAQGAWLETLLAARSSSQAVVYFGDRFEPGLALFHTSIAGLVDKRLAAGVLDMQSLLREANTTKLPLPADWGSAVNVNRMTDVGGD